jgi:hypothetical protein
LRPTLRPALRPLLGLLAAVAAAPPAPAQAPPDPASVVIPTPRPGGGEAPSPDVATPPNENAAAETAPQPDDANAPGVEAPTETDAAADGDTAEEPAEDIALPPPAAPRHAERPVAYAVLNARAIPEPLGGLTGDPAAGPAAAQAAGCAGCHILPDGGNDAENGLAIAAARLGAGGLRLAIVNLGIRDPAFADHAFYDLPPFDPDAETPPNTLLTAAEVEAIVAWLSAAAR